MSLVPRNRIWLVLSLLIGIFGIPTGAWIGLFLWEFNLHALTPERTLICAGFVAGLLFWPGTLASFLSIGLMLLVCVHNPYPERWEILQLSWLHMAEGAVVGKALGLLVRFGVLRRSARGA